MKSVLTKTTWFGLFSALTFTAHSEEKKSEKKKPFSYSESCKYEYKPIFTKDKGMIWLQIPIPDTTSDEAKKEEGDAEVKVKPKFSAKSIADLLMGKNKKDSEATTEEKTITPKPKRGTANPKIH